MRSCQVLISVSDEVLQNTRQIFSEIFSPAETRKNTLIHQHVMGEKTMELKCTGEFSSMYACMCMCVHVREHMHMCAHAHTHESLSRVCMHMFALSKAREGRQLPCLLHSLRQDPSTHPGAKLETASLSGCPVSILHSAPVTMPGFFKGASKHSYPLHHLTNP